MIKPPDHRLWTLLWPGRASRHSRAERHCLRRTSVEGVGRAVAVPDHAVREEACHQDDHYEDRSLGYRFCERLVSPPQ